MSLDFKKILCPVDLSKFSLEALRLGVKIAESSDATLDILHVIHNPFDEIYLTEITQTDPALIEAYAGEPFVRVLGDHVLGEHGLADDVPDLRCVSGSNSVQLALSVRSGVLQVLCTLDNLVKGGAGQALQCLNLMLGFPETWGLPRSGLGVS